MKLIIYLFIAGVFTPAYSCPGCVGRVSPESAPFFSSEFYQAGISPSSKPTVVTEKFKKLSAGHKEIK